MTQVDINVSSHYAYTKIIHSVLYSHTYVHTLNRIVMCVRQNQTWRQRPFRASFSTHECQGNLRMVYDQSLFDAVINEARWTSLLPCAMYYAPHTYFTPALCTVACGHVKMAVLFVFGLCCESSCVAAITGSLSTRNCWWHSFHLPSIVDPWYILLCV